MNITNISKITYTLNNTTTVHANSNNATVSLSVPIVSFMKCKTGNAVRAIIKNNSGLTINNVIYKDVSINKYDYVQGTLKINNHYLKGNPSLGVYLGKIKNNKIINISYQTTSFITCSKKALLIYRYFMNDEKVIVYLLSNVATVIKAP